MVNNNDTFITEEPDRAAPSPGSPSPTSNMQALEAEIRRLRAAIEARPVGTPAPSSPEAATDEDLLNSEGFRELLHESSAETLKEVIRQTPRLDDGAKKSLLLTLDRLATGTETDEAKVAVSEGGRCLELQQGLRAIDAEIAVLKEASGWFSGATGPEKERNRKTIVLLEADALVKQQELDEILSTVPGAVSEERKSSWED